MITPISKSKPGDIVTLKKLYETTGAIIDKNMKLYFKSYNDDKENVTITVDKQGL